MIFTIIYIYLQPTIILLLVSKANDSFIRLMLVNARLMMLRC